MPRLDVRRTYADGYNLLKQDLDAFVDDIETFVNLTRLNDDNFQDAGITASTKIVNGSITNTKFSEGAITTDKITDSAVTSAKIADGAVTTVKLADTTVTTTNIAASAITTAKILDANITTAKLVASNYVSSSLATGSTSSASPLTIASVSITTTGRPVFIGLMSDDTNSGYISYTSTGSVSQLSGNVIFQRDSSTIVNLKMSLTKSAAGIGIIGQTAPGQFFHIDTPAAGTYTYTASAYSGSTSVAIAWRCFLVAVEL